MGYLGEVFFCLPSLLEEGRGWPELLEALQGLGSAGRNPPPNTVCESGCGWEQEPLLVGTRRRLQVISACCPSQIFV